MVHATAAIAGRMSSSRRDSESGFPICSPGVPRGPGIFLQLWLKNLENESVHRYGYSDQFEVAECEGCSMTDRIVPHFHNDVGVAVIEVGAKEFMCVGALPPFDHPHIFLDMGDDTEIICSYCSTLYRFDPALAPNAARPAECALPETETA